MLIGNDALLFTAQQTATVNPQSTVAAVTVTRTPTLRPRQNWHNHLANKLLRSKPLFQKDSNIKCFTRFIYIYASHSMTSPTTPHSVQGFSADGHLSRNFPPFMELEVLYRVPNSLPPIIVSKHPPKYEIRITCNMLVLCAKLEDCTLSAVRDCLFNVFPDNLHVWRFSPFAA
jgi:hypothetical protein